MKLFGLHSAFYFSALVAVFLCSNVPFSVGKDNQKSPPRSMKDSTGATKDNAGGTSSSVVSSSRGLPSLGGLVHGLGLGLRRRRAVGNKVKHTCKDSTCCCRTQYEPLCASNGKTYLNKCMFECAVKKTNKQSNSKNTKKNAKIVSLKIVKRGNCTAAAVTTTFSPVDVHQTVTEVVTAVNETLLNHLSKMMTAETPTMVF